MKPWLRHSLLWILGVLSLSWTFAAFRGLWDVPSLARFSVFMLCLSLFLWDLFMIGYVTYVRERAKGTVVHKIEMYERILKRREAA